MASSQSHNTLQSIASPTIQAAPEAESGEIMFLRLPQVKTITGLSKSSLYALIRANSFPAPVHLGPRTVAWVQSEVKSWAAERAHAPRIPTSIQVNKKGPQSAHAESWASPRKWA